MAMKLIGPWVSGYTRRVGVTLKLLGIPFEHWDKSEGWQGDLRKYSPMAKVPALVLEDGDVLVDSSAIIDYLYEFAGPERSLLPASGIARRNALFHAGIAIEVYSKQLQIFNEMSFEAERRVGRIQYFIVQVFEGFRALEKRIASPWALGEDIGHADIMSVIAFQSASRSPMFSDVNATNFPKLAAVNAMASMLPAFAETLPSRS